MILEVLLTVIFFAISVSVHEFFHAYVADKLGDPTARLSGRLTLNPIAHADLFGTILIPLFLLISGTRFLFGWAKPVPVNFLNLQNPKKDMIKIAIAGPISNIVMGFIAFVIMKFVPENYILYSVLFGAVYLNIALAIFNMIPVFPLDGSKILAGLLPYNLEYKYMQYEKYGSIILLIMVMTGVTGWILQLFAPIILVLYTLLTFWF
jgi:Zn-dependent protease